jgi:beta-propeller repeat-containing protein
MSRNKQIVTARAVAGFVVLGLAIWTGTPHASGRSDAQPRGTMPAATADLKHSPDALLQAYTKLPVAFIENRGQIDGRVRYYAKGSRYAFFLTPQSIVLSFSNTASTDQLALYLNFVGSNPDAVPQGTERAPGAVNYLHGNDPAGWKTEVPRYGQLMYRELWPGIDLYLRDVAGTLKYEFRVRPGANPADIRFAYKGADALSLDAAGSLLVNTSMGVLKDAAPQSYQMIGGTAVPVDSGYALTKGSDGRNDGYGFRVGGYQSDRELVIDPGLEYSTFLGGAGDDIGAAIKVDAAGNAFIVGSTQSPNFPTTAGAFDRTGATNNSLEAFVAKVNPTGTALVYATFIGGSNFEWGRGLAIDAAGNAYVTGQTQSPNFPTTGGAFDRTFNVDTCPRCGIDQYDAFVLKLNAAGSALVYSTFLGGFNIDDGMAIAVDGAGNAYVAGQTEPTNFPITAGAFDRVIDGVDMFVTKLNATGSALVYSTYLGGSGTEFPSRVAVDSGGNLFIAGSTSSTNFPTTAGAFDRTHNGAFDVFLTKLNAAGSALVFSTFLGGSGFDSAGGLAIDSAGNSYVSGGAGSVDFPTTPGAFDTLTDGNDAFVTKFNPAGSALVYSTFLGGSASDGASGLVLDGAGNAWVTGGTTSTDFPIIVGAADSTHNGMSDVFVSELNNTGSTLLYSTFLGGSDSEGGFDIAVDTSGGVYVTGHTFSLNYPTTAGAFDTVWNGDMLVFWGDAFVSKLGSVSSPPSTPPIPAAPALLAPANGANEPQPINFQWAVASGAASYTIQIDDSSAFTAPLVREQQNITTLLIYATSGLSTAPHFWRVRGVNFDGVPGPWSAVRTVNPGTSPPPPGVGSLDINPTTIAGGNASGGTVVLSTGAPFGGAVISLSSSNPSVASVPATVTAPANSFVGLFTIGTSPVAANTTVTITATYNGTSRSGTLTVTPAGAAQGFLSNLAVASPITGGSTGQGSVLLGAVAQADSVVSLSSSNSSIASVPSTVTVPAANQVGVFTVSTSAVSTSTTVTITATFNGGTKTATLTVSPAAPPPPPPQNATLTVTASGRSGERVTSSPAGISVTVGSSGSASFAQGTSITLSTARDAIWSGACSSGGSKRKTCTFTLNANATVSANVQ